MAQSADNIYGKRQFVNTLNQTMQLLLRNSHLQPSPSAIFQILKKKIKQNK